MNDVKKSKLMGAARSVFLRHGFKRVTMNDIAEAAGMSRAALYLAFKNKEDVFIGVFNQWVDETIVDIERAMATAMTPKKQIELAFEIWAVRPFEMMMTSREAKELLECTFDFAFASSRRGYKKFEATIVPIIAAMAEKRLASAHITAAKTAHVLAGAVRGLKQTATKPAELRQLIKQLLSLSLT